MEVAFDQGDQEGDIQDHVRGIYNLAHLKYGDESRDGMTWYDE